MAQVTLDMAQLAQMIAQAVAQSNGKASPAKPSKKAGRQPISRNEAGLSAKQIENEKAVKTAFKRAGFGTVVPKVDVKTFNLWKAEGFIPKEGEKSLKVKQFRLFHRSQVTKMEAQEVEEPTSEQPTNEEITAFIADQAAKAKNINAEKPTLRLFPKE